MTTEFQSFVYCASCNAENRRGDAICIACGQPLPGRELSAEEAQARIEQQQHKSSWLHRLFPWWKRQAS